MPPFSLKNATQAQISIRSSITIHFSPVLHRPHTVLTHSAKTICKGSYRDICLTRISKAFQGKPVIRDFSLTIKREASRQKWENGCPKDPPLRWRCRSPLCSLPSAFFSGWCRMPLRPIKNDSLVSGNSKRMTLTPLSPSCVGSDSRRGISPSLTMPNFSVRRRMMPSPPSKAAFPLALPAPLSAPYGDAHHASYAKTRKESQDPRSRKSSPGNAPLHRPCHHALWE